MAHRANAIILLDQGWSCERVAEALLLDDDTVRNWHRAFERGGIEALKTFDHEGSISPLTDEQAIALGDWIDAHCPRSTRKIGAWLKRSFGLSYSRSGLIALLHRLGFDYAGRRGWFFGRSGSIAAHCTSLSQNSFAMIQASIADSA